jgi:hypothetical protein
MTRTLLLATVPVAFLLAACGPQQSGPASPSASGSAAAPKVEQQQVKNLGYFDVATFSAAPPVVAGRASSEALLGVLLSARPVVMECLVDPKNRGPEKKTHVVLDATLVDAGVEHKATGTNLTPAGTACIEAALRAWTQAIPALTAKNAAGPLKGHLELEHVVGASPSVEMGVNDASDIAGAIRLALPTWGDCFGAWKSAPPRGLRVSVRAARPKEAPPTVSLSTVAFDATSDPVAGKVAACLEGKLKALQVKTPSAESVSLPYTFRFVHSGIGEALPDAAPELQFVELDLQRGRRAAETAIAAGERGLLLAVYDDVVKRFKAKAKPEVSIAELKEKCAALVASADKLVAAAEKQAATEEATHRFTLEQKAKDPSWADAETASAKNLADAQKDVENVKAVRNADQGACPKVTY